MHFNNALPERVSIERGFRTSSSSSDQRSESLLSFSEEEDAISSRNLAKDFAIKASSPCEASSGGPRCCD